MSKIILDLCGGTGAWSKKYKEAGYRVINVTLPNYDLLKTEIRGEHIIFQGGSEKLLMIRISDIYGILASPVCTMFSLARTRAKTSRDFRQGMELIIADLNIIWECRYDHKLAFWCLENLAGILRQFLGKPVFTFDPCDFGDPYTKKTDLWGYFNIPKKNPVEPIFYRVLRKDGVCFVNIGDSYGGSGNASGHKEDTRNLGYKTLEMGATQGNQKTTGRYAKSLLDIPYRFSIEMINRGWIKRNTIIWHKPNCMPSSAPDRFTVDFEYLFFFTKNNKTLFWTNEKTLECISKNPLGTKGIEGKDWEWRPCPACSDKNYFNIRTRDVIKKEKDCPQFKASNEEKENIKNKICPRCKGSGKVKYSFWTGHDYWFEQQFEPILTDSIKRELRGNRTNKYSKDKHLPKGVHPNTMSQVREYRGYDNLEEEILGRKGRNKRCVWTIPTQPFPEAHFAVYPEGLIEIPIRAGCPEFVCKKCGKARVKIFEYKGGTIGKSWHDHSRDLEEGMHQSLGGLDKQGDEPYQRVDKGYSDCGCNAGFEGGIVLDPFMGSGTTAKEALKQRKRFIGIEIKQEYIDMAKKRIKRVQPNLF